MRLLPLLLIALGVAPVPPPKTLVLAAAIPPNVALLPLNKEYKALASPWNPRGPGPGGPAIPAGSLAGLVAPASPAMALVGVGTKALQPPGPAGRDVAAAEGDTQTTTPAAASSTSPEETTTEETYDGGDSDGGGDFGADILNALLEVIGTLLSFFSDPPGAIQKMVEQAQQLTSGARSLMAQGPAGMRQARLMLVEAKRILETARGIVEATGRVANTARSVAQSISRPWTG